MSSVFQHVLEDTWNGMPTRPTGGQPGPRHTAKYVSARDNVVGRADSDRAVL